MTSSLKRLVSSRVTFSGWDDLWIEINSSLERRRSIRRKVTMQYRIPLGDGRESVGSRGEKVWSRDSAARRDRELQVYNLVWQIRKDKKCRTERKGKFSVTESTGLNSIYLRIWRSIYYGLTTNQIPTTIFDQRKDSYYCIAIIVSIPTNERPEIYPIDLPFLTAAWIRTYTEKNTNDEAK